MNTEMNLQDEPIAEPGTPEDLEQRLRLMPLGDMARGIVFSTMLESVRQEGDEEALRRCLAVTGEPHHLAFFNYPVQTLLKLTHTAGWALSDRYGGFDGALRRLGSRAVPDFFQSTVGKMMLNMAGMDAKSLFGWVPVIYPTIYHHGSYKLTWMGNKHARVMLSGSLFYPAFIEAAMTQMLLTFDLAEFSGRARRVSLRDIEMVFSWK